MKRQGSVPLLVAAAGLLAALSAGATTISLTGLPGTPGTDAPPGNPGGTGGTGGDGEDVQFEATTPGEDHSVSVTGGAGGRGGTGGDGIPAGSDAGDGGDGGAGGDATARALGTDTSSVTASATAGDRGVAGFPGSATGPGVPGDPGNAGVSGNASAEATLAITSGDGDGAATASARGTGFGGDTTADARATTEGGGALTVTATAHGGDVIGGSGTSSATAYGENAGVAPVEVTAAANNLALSVGFGGGELAASAEGHSSGGGDVEVTASVLRELGMSFSDYEQAPSLSLHDAVSGSTSGRLTLRQWLNIAPGPLGPTFGDAGEVQTSLHATNPGGGALSVDVVAFAGLGRDAVLGDILATSVTGADVDLRVHAAPGQRGGRVVRENRSEGEPPTPSRIHAESNGGAVTVDVTSGASQGFQQDHPDGFSFDMENFASGDTTGALVLRQIAVAGDGVFAGIPPDPAGSGGDARSVLTKQTASQSLELRTEARAGAAGQGTNLGQTGGDALAIVDGSNSSGDVRVTAKAMSGGFQLTNLSGGNAVVDARASTAGDGHAVVVGAALPETFNPRASGHFAAGDSVDIQCFGNCGTALPSGGAASSTSLGVAAGDSSVTVFDNAVGGDGGSARSTSNFIGSGGSGGSAASSATATGNGFSVVESASEARGGSGGFGSLGGVGGDAVAFAQASGLGPVEARARASGGNSIGRNTGPPVPPGDAGSGLARAQISGSSGIASADARTGVGAHARVRAQSEAFLSAPITGAAKVVAQATHSASLVSAPSGEAPDGLAFFTSDPLAQDVDATLAGNTALADRFAGSAGEMLALAHWEGNSQLVDPLALTTQLELVLGADEPTDNLVLGAFGVSVLGDGFGSLSFSLFKNGAALGATQHFDSASAVLDYFTDSVLDLGVGWKAGDALLARFELEIERGASVAIGLGFAAAIPEPGTGLLVVLGLIVLSRRRRRQ